MQQSPPAIRLLPMSDKTPGFTKQSILQIQSTFFLQKLPARQGRFLFPTSALIAPPRTLVLFQFKAHIIASALLLRIEKFPTPKLNHAGALHFDPASIRTFSPLNFQALQKIWPALRPLGHIKQSLNPARCPTFKKHLKDLTAPVPETKKNP